MSYGISFPLRSADTVPVTQGAERGEVGIAKLASAPLSTTRINGLAYTLTPDDSGTVLVVTNGADVAITVPSGLGRGFNCVVIQAGAGQATFSGSGATVSNRQSQTKTAGQYAVMSLIAVAPDVLVLAGDGA